MGNQGRSLNSEIKLGHAMFYAVDLLTIKYVLHFLLWRLWCGEVDPALQSEVNTF